MCVLARRNRQSGKSTRLLRFLQLRCAWIYKFFGATSAAWERERVYIVSSLTHSVSHTPRSLSLSLACMRLSRGKLKSALQMMFYWLREVAAAVVTFLIWPCSSIDIGRMLNSRRLLLVLWSYATRLETSLGLGLFFCSFFSLSLSLQLQSHQKILSLTGSNRSAE